MTMTATEMLRREMQEQRDLDRLHRLHFHFRDLYAPEDADKRDRFEADLAMLIHEACREAQKPFHDAAARAIAAQPMPPVVLPSD